MNLKGFANLDRVRELEWKLRYGILSHGEILTVASIISQYRALLYATQKDRDEVIKHLKTTEAELEVIE